MYCRRNLNGGWSALSDTQLCRCLLSHAQANCSMYYTQQPRRHFWRVLISLHIDESRPFGGCPWLQSAKTQHQRKTHKPLLMNCGAVNTINEKVSKCTPSRLDPSPERPQTFLYIIALCDFRQGQASSHDQLATRQTSFTIPLAFVVSVNETNRVLQCLSALCACTFDGQLLMHDVYKGCRRMFG